MKANFRLVTLAGTLFLYSGFAAAQTAQPAPRDDTQIWPEVQLTVPLNRKIDLNVIGQLRIGRNATDFVDERGGMGFTFRANSYLSLTSWYLHIATQPTPDRKNFENRLNFAATLRLPEMRGFSISNRSLIERRIRQPLNSTRYRNRTQVERAVTISGKDFRLFVSDEVFYDWTARGWVRNRFAVGANRRLRDKVTGELYYMRQMDGRSRPGNLNVIGFVIRILLPARSP